MLKAQFAKRKKLSTAAPSPSNSSNTMFIYLKRNTTTQNKAEVMTLCKAIVFLGMGLLALVMVGLMGHYYGYQKKPSNTTAQTQYDSWIRRKLFDQFNGTKIGENLRNLTLKPHVSGTGNNDKVAKFIADKWKEYGLKGVHYAEYTGVLLSYPDYSKPNKVELLDEYGNINYQTSGISKPIIHSEQNDPKARNQWNAYSANGTVQGPLVYCDYGRSIDFDYLHSIGVKVKGKIAIIRYGKLYRGDKVSEAQKRGVKAVILYSDPTLVAAEGSDPEQVYPNTIWMPPEGVQRGSVMNFKGDLLTPLYPAKKYTYRSQTVAEAQKLNLIPLIPVLPISYGDAKHFLEKLSGENVPFSWKENHKNISQTTGLETSPKWKVRVSVRSNLERKTIKNVIGYIPGIHEPHRYIIVGNHYDAWGYGSVDPNSGTAIMLEMSRVIMATRNNTDWHPSRTIIFCAWDAEEFGLIGSTEWVEEHSQILSDRAIIYLNVDNVNGNETLFIRAVPSLHKTVIDAAKDVPNPDPKEMSQRRYSVYDTWMKKLPNKDKKEPYVGMINGGSDQLQFLQYLGIAAVDIRYTDTKTYGYPLYHTMYETPYLNEKLMHPKANYEVHVAVGRYWLELVRRFSDYSPLPFNMTHYANTIEKYVEIMTKNIESTLDPKDYREPAVQLGYLKKALEKFWYKSLVFHKDSDKLDPSNVYEQPLLAYVNECLAKLERCFVNPRGLVGRPYIRHTVLGLNPYNTYKGATFPGIYDALHKYENSEDKKKRNRAVRRLCEEISIVQYGVECACNVITQFL